MNQEIFQQKLKDLVTLAKNNQKQLHRQVAEQFFQEDGLSGQQLSLVLDYLRSQGIHVSGEDFQEAGDGLASSVADGSRASSAAGGWAPSAAGGSQASSAAGGWAPCGADGSQAPSTAPGSRELRKAAPGFSPEEAPAPLTPEDQQVLAEYRARFSSLSQPSPEELSRLFADARRGREAARQQLLQLYLPVTVELSAQYPGSVPLQDKIQEGSLGLWTALEDGLPEAGEDAYLRAAVSRSISRLLQEESQQKRQDGFLVERVRSLEAKVRELTEDSEVKFSVEELSAFLDMEVEEIQSILKLTGED